MDRRVLIGDHDSHRRSWLTPLPFAESLLTSFAVDAVEVVDGFPKARTHAGCVEERANELRVERLIQIKLASPKQVVSTRSPQQNCSARVNTVLMLKVERGRRRVCFYLLILASPRPDSRGFLHFPTSFSK
jgi:hypothetical protein